MSLGGHRVETFLGELHQVHLVDRRDDVADAEQRRDLGMAAGLDDHAAPSVDEQDGEIRSRRAGEHVAGVALVPGGVGQNESASRSREVAVRHVDRDALLALGTQPVRERGEVGGSVALRHGGQLIRQQQLGVEQQTADEGRLAVVDGAGGCQAQQLAGTRPGHA